MEIDIHVKRPGQDLPPLELNSVRYVVAHEGTYLERRTSAYSSSVRVVGSISGLESHQQQCMLHTPPIPLKMLQQMIGFFQYAQRFHGGEAALILLYHPQKKHFRWYCPLQTVEVQNWYGGWYASDSVEFANPIDLPEGHVAFGDAHSHLGPPVASDTDRNDEEFQDGLHIIAGYISSRRPEIYVVFGIDGQRFKVLPEDILATDPTPPFPHPPRSWVARLHVIEKKPWYATRSFADTSNHAARPESRQVDLPAEGAKEEPSSEATDGVKTAGKPTASHPNSNGNLEVPAEEDSQHD